MSAARLIHIDDGLPGITRERVADGWRYRDTKGKIIRDRDEVTRLNAIALPPAYEDAWFCPAANGHILATGYDARGRKQYRYHPDFRLAQDAEKYDRCAAFGHALPLLRARLEEDLARRTLCQERVVGAVVRLLDLAALRVGNEQYVAANKSFGATTSVGRVSRLAVQVHLLVHGRAVAAVFLGLAVDGGLHPPAAGSARPAYRRPWIGQRLRGRVGQRQRLYPGRDGGRVQRQAFPHLDRQRRGVRLPLRRPRAVLLNGVTCIADRLGNTPAIARKAYVHPATIAAAQARGDFAAAAGSLLFRRPIFRVTNADFWPIWSGPPMRRRCSVPPDPTKRTPKAPL